MRVNVERLTELEVQCTGRECSFSKQHVADVLDLIDDLRDARTMLYKLAQITSTRSDWKPHIWKFIEECEALARAGGKSVP